MIRGSIRTRLFLGVISLTIFFVLFSWFLNINFLDKYYLAQKGAALHKAYNYINEIYSGDMGAVHSELEKIVHATGINIVILDRDFAIKYDSAPRPRGLPPRPAPAEHRFPHFISQTADWSKPTYRVDRTRNPANTEYLNFTAKLRNGDYLWLGMPLAEIQQGVAISNQFFLLTGLLTILIGGIIVSFYSKRFTRPILELNAIAQNMAKLDFTKMYPVRSQDEIGELGHSINSLSEQLGRSIRELQQANRRLEEDNERQKKIDEIRKEFISNVSHELKTPIALIQGYSEGLKLNVIENEADKNFYCNVIMDEAAKMNKLVRELLDLSEIDSGFLRLDMETFDLAQLTERVLEKYHLLLKEREIHLVFEADHPAWVRADISRIEQVLANYIDNALGHIEAEKLLRVGVQVRDGKVRCTVFNSGQPIPEEVTEKIWMSFYKVDKARTRAYGGTGLGLSIVRAIMERHQGGFGVRNLEGGVEFWFELEQAVPDEA